jgi:uncharacterized protein YbjT (DUF2867 family)
MLRKIMVTGATGNVGREVVNLLLDEGETVVAITRNPATAESLSPLAVEQGVERVVVLSAITAEYPLGERRFAEQFKAVEGTAKTSGLHWTVLRNADFDSNSLAWAPQIWSAVVVRGADGNAAISTVHEGDIAAVAVRALTNSKHSGRPYLLIIPQNETEKISKRRLNEVGVWIERGVELRSLREDLNSVTAILGVRG